MTDYYQAKLITIVTNINMDESHEHNVEERKQITE